MQSIGVFAFWKYWFKIKLDFAILIAYICSEQSSDFFHQLYNFSKKYCMDPTKYIYIESTRRNLQNDVKILVKTFS